MTERKSAVQSAQPINPWGSSLDKLREWDPVGAELLMRVATSPWNSGVLPRKEVELISVALHCACPFVQPRRSHPSGGDEGCGHRSRWRSEA